MLRLHRAERASTLALALADVLRTPLEDPFTAEIIAVPAKGVERWLNQRLASVLGAVTTDGVAANLVFPSPTALVAQAIGAATGVDPELDLWSPARLTWSVLDVIDASLDEPWCAALARHLGHDGAGDDRRSGREHRSGRRFATATHVAELFRRYGADRPTMLVRWAAGADADETGAELSPDLIWQSRLWRAVRERIATASPPERLPAAGDRLRAEPGLVDLPARISLFGPTRLTTEELTVLGALAAHRDVHLWLAHPSPAMWRKLGADPLLVQLGNRRGDDQSALAVTHPMLASLARDVRELQLRLARFDRVDVHHDTSLDDVTLLKRIQADVKHDRAPSVMATLGDSARPGITPEGTALDGTVQIHACHGPPRQVEVLRESLLRLFQADPTLEPRDVLVMCPDVETYAPLVQAAFGQLASDEDDGRLHPGHQLRVRLADRGLRETNPLLEIVAAVLEMADGRVTASQVLDLAARPPVRQRFGFSDDDLERLREWAASSGVRWGIGRRQRAAYDLADVRQNTWNAAVDRILLGVTADESESKWLGLALPLDDVDSFDIDLSGRLAELVDRLASVIKTLQGPQPARAWTDALGRSIDLLTDVAPNELWQLAQARRELSAASQSSLSAPLRLSDARSMLTYRLVGKPTRANFRTGELTVATLVPMRSVPHRVVALLGLDDEVFPRGMGLDGDDILSRQPCLGERDPRSEDRQLLLDAVMSAGEHLLICYTGADPVTGSTRPPAIPLSELLDVVSAMVGPQAAANVVTRHPLQPYDQRNFLRPKPFSFDRAALAGARAHQRRPAPAPYLLATPLPPRVGDVELADLVAFAVHPTQAFLRQRLGVRIPQSDDDVLDALSIELDGLGKWDIGDRMLTARIDGAPMKDLVWAERLRGTVPPQRLGTTMLADIERAVEWLAEAARAVHVGPPTTLDVEVDLGGGRRVVGTVTGLHGRTLASTSYSTLADKHRLSAWVKLLAVAAGGEPESSTPAAPWRAITTGRGRHRAPLARSTLMAPPDALHELNRLVDLRDRGLQAPLPLATGASAQYAERRFRGGTVIEAHDAAERQWNDRFGDGTDRHLAYVYGPTPRFDQLYDERPPDDERLWTDDPTRFGVLANRLWAPLLRAETLAAR